LDELRVVNRYNRARAAKSGDRERDIWDMLNNERLYSGGVLLYGAGANAKYCVGLLNARQVGILAVADSSPEKRGLLVAGTEVVSPQELARIPDAPVVITPLSQRNKEEIRKTLLALGMTESRIYYCHPQQYGKQYFGPSFMSPVSNEVYIDGGCYDGETILDFYEFAGGEGTVYGFEPDPDCYVRTKDVLRKNNKRNVTLIQKGLFDGAEILPFDRTYMSMAGSKISSGGKDRIETATIDETVPGKVTLIKMDIEGAELAALKGARNTIARYRPRLAICIYHKRQDVVEIPWYILSLHADYRLYIRHHSPRLGLETVLYAV
jgi:FkbM family methyltransferase